MGILLIVIGALLALFGGGCTVIWGFVAFESASLDGFGFWLILGFAPLALGVLMIYGGYRLHVDPPGTRHQGRE